MKTLSICVATSDISGPTRCGGVGTAYGALAKALARAGHKVTILFAPDVDSIVHDMAQWQTYYGDHAVELVQVLQPAIPLEGTENAKRSYTVYSWLKKRKFDVIHFPDMRGLGYYCTLARRQGLHFQNTIICVGAHGPAVWHKEGSREFLDSLTDIELEFLERKTIEYADWVISPSQYMLEWLQGKGWVLPKNVKVIQNLLPVLPEPQLVVGPLTEIVFFGRLETRKGLKVFCDALDLLPGAMTNATNFSVTFLGKPGLVDGISADSYISRRKISRAGRTQVLPSFNHDQTLAYMSKGSRLFVIPSLCDNSPYTVLECAALGVSFISSAVGGVPELIRAEDRRCVLVNAADASELANAISAAMNTPSLARVAKDQRETETEWLTWHNDVSIGPAHVASFRQPRVSVCIPHYERPQLLAQALESLREQTYKNFEVLVADDGTSSPNNLRLFEQLKNETKDLKIRFLGGTKAGVNEMRNLCAREAMGEYLLFMDDDNYAKPEEIATFVRAALATGADILTCPFDRFFLKSNPTELAQPVSRWVPLGDALSLGFFFNIFGDMNCFIKKEKFFFAGALSTAQNFIGEDWEFFARAVLAGLSLSVVPEALYLYRDHRGTLSKTAPGYESANERLKVFYDCVPKPLGLLLETLYGSRLQPRETAELDAANVFVPIATFKSEAGLSEFRALNSMTKLLRSTGSLVVESKGDDPALLLPEFFAAAASRIVLQIEISAEKDDCLQLFYSASSKFSEEDSVSCLIREGWNFRRLFIKSSQHIQRLRLDPGRSAGKFEIHSVEVLADVSTQDLAGRRYAEFLASKKRVEQGPPDTGHSTTCLNLLAGPNHSIEAAGNCDVLNTPSGLLFTAKTSDPFVLLTPLFFAPNTNLLFEIEIEAPIDTTLQIFYMSVSRAQFSEQNSISRFIKKGRNHLEILLHVPSGITGLRFDPGSSDGSYILTKFLLRINPQHSRTELVIGRSDITQDILDI